MTDRREIVGRLPDGARDILPVEARELRGIEGALRDTFALYGYQQVGTPVLEYADVLEQGIDQPLGDAFRLFDGAGRVMVLRPDITVPVSRMIATRMADHADPIRAFYFGRAFRPPPAGAPRPAELRQAGAELVGVSGPEADAELIVLLHRALSRAGIEDLTIAVGDIALTAAVLDGLGASGELRAELGRALAARDLVRWRELVLASDLPADRREAAAGLPGLRGGPEVLDRLAAIAPGARDACAATRELLERLARAEIGDDVLLDVVIARDWPYYSGVVLEAHAPGAGAPLAVGGRYDRLAERFGTARPAVGFAIDLDVLHRAINAAGQSPRRPEAGVVVVGGLGALATDAERIRARGVPAAAVGPDHPDPGGLARALGWSFVVRARDGGLGIERLDSGELGQCADAEEVVRWMA